MPPSSFSLLSLALPSRVARKRRWQRCPLYSPRKGSATGTNTRASQSKRFLAEVWVQQELVSEFQRWGTISSEWAQIKPRTAVSLHSPTPLPGSAFMVLYPLSPLGDLHLCLDSKVKCYLYISSEFMTLLQLFLLHIRKNISKLFPTISIPRKPWEQIHECSARLWPKCFIFEVWTVRWPYSQVNPKK